MNDTATDTTGGLSLAQSFLVPGDPGSTKEVAAVSLPLYYNAAVGGTLTLTLRQNNAGVPGTTLTGSTVTKTTTSTVTSTSPILIQFDMSNVQSLAAGSTFWIVLEASYSQRSTPVIKWAADDGNTNSSAYANGLAKYEGDGSPVTLNTFSTGTLGSLRELGFSITCN